MSIFRIWLNLLVQMIHDQVCFLIQNRFFRMDDPRRKFSGIKENGQPSSEPVSKSRLLWLRCLILRCKNVSPSNIRLQGLSSTSPTSSTAISLIKRNFVHNHRVLWITHVPAVFRNQPATSDTVSSGRSSGLSEECFATPAPSGCEQGISILDHSQTGFCLRRHDFSKPEKLFSVKCFLSPSFGSLESTHCIQNG